MRYRFEVKVSGWITRIVEAPSLEEAREIAADITILSEPIANLQWKEIEVQDYKE